MNSEYSLIIPFHVRTVSDIAENRTWLRGIVLNNPNAEIIIVDNGSCAEWKPVMREQLNRPGIKTVVFKNAISYSQACNAGAAEATTDIFCFLNSDVVISSENWARPFMEALLKPSVGIVGASGRRINATDWWGGELRYSGDIDYAEGWCLWLTLETFDAVGGFDENFTPFYCEDSDLCFRIQHKLKKTIEIIPTKEQKIIHAGGQTIKRHCADERALLNKNTKLFRNKWEHLFVPGVGFHDNFRIAIIIPAHVPERYLIKCLDSTITQTGAKIKIYVGLDKMMFFQEKKYPFVKFYKFDVGEVNHVRNFLIKNTDEPFIYFLDADNYLLPSAIGKLKREMMETGADVVSSQARIRDESADHWFKNQVGGLLNTHALDERKIRGGNHLDMGALVRRSALPSQEPFDMRLPNLHDWDLWLTMIEAGAKFAFVNEPLYVYRIHENNLSKNQSHWETSVRIMREKHGSDIGIKQKNGPRVSVVVIAKTQQEIEDKKRELSKQTVKPDEYCTSTNPDLATAWTEAFNKVTGDIVVVTESDARMLNERFIEELISNVRDGEITKGLEISHEWENFANIAFPAGLLKRFPVTKEYGIAQDTEFFCRCKGSGIRVRRINGATVIHDRGFASKKQIERAYRYGRLHVRLMKKYNYHPLSEYVERLEIQRDAANETLRGINDELGK